MKLEIAELGHVSKVTQDYTSVWWWDAPVYDFKRYPEVS